MNTEIITRYINKAYEIYKNNIGKNDDLANLGEVASYLFRYTRDENVNDVKMAMQYFDKIKGE